MLRKDNSLMFVSLDYYRTKDPKTPLAIASIEAYFRKNGPQYFESAFRSFDISHDSFNIELVLRAIRLERPTLLAIGVYIWNEHFVQEILSYVRRVLPGTQIILGGPQITFGGPELSKEYLGADWFVRGAGEVPFSWLVAALAAGTPPLAGEGHAQGVYHRKDLAGQDNLLINQTPLEMLPSPFLDGIVPLERYAPFQRWETLRGCPYRCTFCQFKIESMKPVQIPHSRIFSELELFHEKRVNEIAVLDPIFNFQKEHYLPILNKIDSLGMKSTFSLQARLELLTREHGKAFLDWASAYKNVKLEFGVQTFIEAESKASQRGNHLGQIEAGINLLHHFNVDFELHLILGLPHQTPENFLRSYQKALNAHPNQLNIYPLNILKGTAIHDRATEWGYEWNPFDYNIFESSQWMGKEFVDEMKEFAAEINARSKATPLGEKTVLPNLIGRLSA